ERRCNPARGKDAKTHTQRDCQQGKKLRFSLHFKHALIGISLGLFGDDCPLKRRDRTVAAKHLDKTFAAVHLEFAGSDQLRLATLIDKAFHELIGRHLLSGSVLAVRASYE